MSSESKPGPAGENSRRDFFQKIGTLAAASSVAANASAAQQPPAPGAAAPGRGGRGNAQPVPGPLSKEPMPMVSFGGKMISRLIIGSNTVAGGTHFSRMIDTEMQAWNTPERMTQVFKHAQELGVNCMEDGAQRIPKFNTENDGKMLFTTRGSASPNNTTAAGRSAAAIAKLGPVAIHHGGAGDTGTDAWWRQGKLGKVRDWCKAMKDAGVTVAVTSHRPEVFDQIESENWDKDVDYYMCCLYKYGRTHAEWEKLFAASPGMAPVQIGWPAEGGSDVYGGEVSFVRGDPPEMLKIVKQTKKPCFVYKLMACGRLCERQQDVEATFKYVLSNIKSTDAVVVGMYDKHMDQYALNKEYVIKYGGTSIKVA
jgi:hypothetical protein